MRRAARIGSAKAYCLTTEEGGTCVTLLDGILGAFGSVERLRGMLGRAKAPARGSVRTAVLPICLTRRNPRPPFGVSRVKGHPADSDEGGH